MLKSFFIAKSKTAFGSETYFFLLIPSLLSFDNRMIILRMTAKRLGNTVGYNPERSPFKHKVTDYHTILNRLV